MLNLRRNRSMILTAVLAAAAPQTLRADDCVWNSYSYPDGRAGGSYFCFYDGYTCTYSYALVNGGWQLTGSRCRYSMT
jgi:hypothetical protein